VEMWLIGLLVVAVIVAAGLAAWFYMQKRRTDELSTRYGDEYRHTVEKTGDRRKAESDLEAREERVRGLDIRPLSSDQRRDFIRRWEQVQADFVDDPRGSIGDADRLLIEVMETRGYPVGDFERRAEDISVDHPRVVQHYRAAHAVAARHEQDGVETEDLRRAMVDYRALFEELVSSTDRQGDDDERSRTRDTAAARRG
jgi:hypothetical protein